VQEVIDNEEVLNRLILNLTYHTNTIEGSTMTLDDTKEVLFNNKILTNRTQVDRLKPATIKQHCYGFLTNLKERFL